MNRVLFRNDKIVILEAKSPKYGNKRFIIDAYNFEKVIKYHWCINKIHTNFYCTARIYDRETRKQTSITLHRYLLNARKHDGSVIDHRNNNSLDYREENLRFCTYQQNRQNSRPRKNTLTGYKGVSTNKDCETKPFRAAIKFSEKSFHLGSYKTAKQAARAYNEAAQEYYGDFAYLNNV